MTDKPGNHQRGLSIFDHPGDDDSARPDDSTQVIPQVSSPGPDDRSAPRRAAAPSFPVVRRGGYDKAPVDRFVASFHAGQADASAGVHAAEQENRRLNTRVG